MAQALTSKAPMHWSLPKPGQSQKSCTHDVAIKVLPIEEVKDQLRVSCYIRIKTRQIKTN